MIASLLPDNPPALIAQAIFMALFWGGVVLLPMAGIVCLFYFAISSPLRRQERARFLLHFIEIGFSMKRTPEDLLTSASETRDATLGSRFHLLAAYIQSGFGFGEALSKVPRLLPPPVAAMLRVGEAIGDIRKVLPACRRLLGDGTSQMRSAQSYAYLVIFSIMPVIPFLALLLQNIILPKFRSITQDFGDPTPLLNVHLLKVATWMSLVPMGVSFLLIFFTVGYLGGPQFVRWMQAGIVPIGDWVACRISWKRLRMQRDFFAMLGLLLDAAIPEPRAVQLAAASTANRAFINRAQLVVNDLSAGKNLVDALARLDARGEFKWRFENAAKSNAGFANALSGWLDALDARAFKNEQTTAQVVTTSVVLYNGAVVGTFLVVMFGFLVHIVEAGCLW